MPMNSDILSELELMDLVLQLVYLSIAFDNNIEQLLGCRSTRRHTGKISSKAAAESRGVFILVFIEAMPGKISDYHWHVYFTS